MANGLINLQTDLTSLRYGSDKPYITKNIGQAPGSQLGLEVQARIDDTSRIAQMLIDKPGLKYLANEALLQQINIDDKIRNRGNKTVAGAVLGQLGNTLIGTAKILGSTLAQVPVNGTGLHFLKGFRTDTYLQPTNGNQASGFAQFFGAGGVEGAPLALQGKPIEGVVESNFYAGSGIVTSRLESLDLSKTTNTYTPSNDFSKAITPEGQASRVFQSDTVQGSISNLTTGSYGPDNLGIVQPETSTYSETKTYTSASQSIPTFNKNVTKEVRLKLGDQGARKDEAKRANYYWITTNSKDEVDKINALAPQDGQVRGDREGRDIVKFRFHILTPDQTGEGKVLYFRAFLDSFNDNYTGTWNPVKYLGRAEDFQVYGGFQRKISLSFKIAAATRSEMKPLYQKMIWLASATAPTYTADKQFMRGTIVKMTVGDYVYELPGVLNSLTYTWQQDYPWEIAMLEPENQPDKDMQELPMIMDCQLDFTPIHTFTPETGLNKFFTAGNNGKNSYV